jgi:hypothetical protein
MKYFDMEGNMSGSSGKVTLSSPAVQNQSSRHTGRPGTRSSHRAG